MVTGTASNDVIDAGHGGKLLVGSGGADQFVFANVDIHAATAPPLTRVADGRHCGATFVTGRHFPGT